MIIYNEEFSNLTELYKFEKRNFKKIKIHDIIYNQQTKKYLIEFVYLK